MLHFMAGIVPWMKQSIPCEDQNTAIGFPRTDCLSGKVDRRGSASVIQDSKQRILFYHLIMFKRLPYVFGIREAAIHVFARHFSQLRTLFGPPVRTPTEVLHVKCTPLPECGRTGDCPRTPL
jgi:hypothetical protein